MMIFVYVRLENIVGKGETGYQHFLLFPQCFQKTFSIRLLQVRVNMTNKPINPYPDVQISGSSISAANKDMMSKYGQMQIQISD